MVRAHQRLDQRGGKIFKNIHGLAAGLAMDIREYRWACKGHVQLSDSAGAQPSSQYHCTRGYHKWVRLRMYPNCPASIAPFNIQSKNRDFQCLGT